MKDLCVYDAMRYSVGRDRSERIRAEITYMLRNSIHNSKVSSRLEKISVNISRAHKSSIVYGCY